MVSIGNKNSINIPATNNLDKVGNERSPQDLKNDSKSEISLEFKDDKDLKNYKADDLKNKVSFNMINPLSPVSCSSFPPEIGCDINTKENNLQMINRFGTESTQQSINDAVDFLKSKNLIPKVKNNKNILKDLSTDKINYNNLIKDTGITNHKNGYISIGNDAFKSKGLLRAVVLHELLHRKDFINGDMFNNTVYNRHMEIYPNVFKLRRELEFTKSDTDTYLNKFLSIRKNEKVKENWIPEK